MSTALHKTMLNSLRCRREICRYGLAAVATFGVAALLSLFADPPIGALLLPIIVAAHVGRLGAGLFATACASFAGIAIGGSPLRVGAVVVIGLVVCGVIEALHRSRAREALAHIRTAEASQRAAQIFNSSPIGISLSRLHDRRVIEVNEAYLRLFGLRRDEIIGQPSHDGCVATVDDDVLDAVQCEVTTPGGPKVIMLWRRLVIFGGEQFALTSFLDMTAHKAAEAAARANEERLRDVTEVMSEVVWLFDVAPLQMLYVSAAYERVWGRSVESLHRDPLDWIGAVHPDDRPRAQAMVASIGTLMERHEERYRIAHVDGAERVVRIAVFPVGAHRVGGLVQDITQEVQLEQQVRQAAKLESIGLLAGGVAHDFNNVLAVISANASLLAESIPSDSSDGELVTEISDAVVRATAMTRQLLAFSRKEVVEPVVLDVSNAIQDTRKMLRRMVGEDIVIETSFEPELASVRIDPGYLVQVLMNLAVNARDAMPRGGTLSISTRNSIGVSRREVLIQISDTGCGMPPEVQARVFEPFFTTKGVGKGTGLGLSVVHGIVAQAGGRIDIDSVVGVGTTLRIYLPSVDARPDRIASLDVAGARGTELVLMVEDDVFIRRSAARALRSRGYGVLEAADGPSALRLLENHHCNIALLLTDVVMPGMDGSELARIAQQRCPALKVLFMSGYTDDAVLRHGVSTATMSLIEKPFRGHALSGRVRQILDGPTRERRASAAC